MLAALQQKLSWPFLNSKRMYSVACYESKSTNPFFNLAFESYLFRKSVQETYILFTWRNRQCVVIGRNQNAWRECDLVFMKQHKIPLVRRESGGGTVYHDMGNALFSVIMPRSTFHRDKFLYIVTEALQSLDIDAEINHRHDIVINGKKISGSAYKLVNTRAYHHGTMLIETDLSLISSILHTSEKNIQSRGVESVKSPVTNLIDVSSNLTFGLFISALQKQFFKHFSINDFAVNTVDESILDTNSHVLDTFNQLKSWDWIVGQNPKFSWVLSKTFSFGNVKVHLESNKGIIEHLNVTQCSNENVSKKINKFLACYIGKKLDSTPIFIKDEKDELFCIQSWLNQQFSI